MQVYTYGETLYSFMKAKDITISKLSYKMNLKSKTTVARILKDESSFKTMQAFNNNLIRTNPLNLTEYEKRLLEEALQVNQIGKDNYTANKELMYFVVRKDNISDMICSGVFGNPPLEIKTLKDLFDTYGLHKKVRICVINAASPGLIKAFTDFLDTGGPDTRIEHYFAYEQNNSVDIRNFINLLPILSKSNYNAYQAYFPVNGNNEKLNRFSNSIIALKTDFGGECSADIVSIKNESEFTVLYNQRGADICDFFHEIFDDMFLHHVSVKSNGYEEDPIDGLIHISSVLLELERSWEQILIKPGFCFNAISPETMLTLLTDNTIPADKHNTLLSLHTARFENYINGRGRHIGIHTEQGITDFINTGYMSDHIPIFRAFTQEEALACVKRIIEITENNPAHDIYLLKNEINYNQYQYTLYGCEAMFFCDRNADYNTNFSYILNSNAAVNAFYHFIKDELIVNYCYSAKESMHILKGIINTR